MEEDVLTIARENNEVAGSVVSFVPVLVMDNLTLEQRTMKHPFCDEDVLSYIPVRVGPHVPGRIDKGVAVLEYPRLSDVFCTARGGAVSVSAGPACSHLDGRSTVGARTSGGFSPALHTAIVPRTVEFAVRPMEPGSTAVTHDVFCQSVASFGREYTQALPRCIAMPKLATDGVVARLSAEDPGYIPEPARGEVDLFATVRTCSSHISDRTDGVETSQAMSL